MKRSFLLTTLVASAVIAVLASDALARYRMYNPATGTFMQRDPAGTPLVTPAARNLSGSQFTQRDPTEQYADGVGLYTYVRSNPVNRADPLGLQSRLTYKFNASADALKLRRAAQGMRLSGWTYASDLMEHALNGGGDIRFGPDSAIAKALGAAPEIKYTLDLDVRSVLPEAAGPLECQSSTKVSLSRRLFGVSFGSGELQAAVRSPDLITYSLLLNVSRWCDGTLLSNDHFCCNAYLYDGEAKVHLTDKYDFHDPNAPAYSKEGTLKKWALEWAYSAQQGGFLTPFTIDVDFVVKVEGDLCGE